MFGRLPIFALEAKLTGKRSAGNPHAAFDVARARNGAMGQAMA